MRNKVLEVNDLNVSFWTNNGMVRAVRGITFDLYKGETLAIVGESGSGKSVCTRTILGILSNNAVIDSGEILYEGMDLTKVHEDDFHRIRGHKIGMIFQDPLSSLNPIMRIGKQITEGILLNGDREKKYFNALINDELIEYRKSVNKIKEAKRKLKNSKVTLHKEMKLIKLQAKNKSFSLAVNVEDERKLAIAALEAKIEELKVAAAINEEKVENLSDYKVIQEQIKAVNADAASKVNVIRTETRSTKKALIKSLKDDLKANVSHQKEESASIIAQEKPLLAKRKAELSKAKARASVATKEHFAKVIAEVKQNIALVEAKIKDSSNYGVKENLQVELASLKESLKRVKKITKAEAEERALRVMEEVGIPEAKKRFKQFPFQFSGGMRQRIVIAIALTQNPEVLICDEPTTALDVTIQSQILELINDLKEKRNMSVIFITHDLGVVANMADRVAVMYAGKIVEKGTVEDIFYEPKHPYTWALLSAMPDLETKDKLGFIPGTPPNMLFPPKGDAFAARNSYAMKIDFEEQPPMFKVSDTHYAATWLLHPDAPKVEMPEIIKDRIQRMQSLTKENN